MTSHHYHLQHSHLNVCLDHFLKLVNLFVQLSYLFVPVPVSMSHSSLYQPVVTSAPCVSPVRITTATFPSHIPNICYTDASIRSFSSKLKTTSSLKSSLSSHQKYAPTSANKSPYSSGPVCVSSAPVTTLSILSDKNSDRASSVPRSNLPSSIAVSSVNSLIHLM